MSGVVLVLVGSIGAVLLIVLANVITAANDEHERAGLFGRERRAHRLEVEALAAHLAADRARAGTTSLAELVAALDRLAFGGVPIDRCAPTPAFGWWTLSFRDGTELCVQVGDPRTMGRVQALATREPVVVSHVHPHPDSAVVALASPRHRPLRVALRS